MRLLSKSELERNSSEERRKQIEEGMKLAKKVDELRQTQYTEQVNTQKYKESSVLQLSKEITALVEQKKDIQKEVNSLLIQHTELRVPLDLEWEKVNSKSNELTQIESSLKEKEYELKNKESEIHKKNTELNTETLRIEDIKENTDKNFKESTSLVEESRLKLSLAENEATRILNECTNKQHAIDSKEANVLFKEDYINKREYYINQREIEINERERLVNDKYQTLERTLNRLKTQK